MPYTPHTPGDVAAMLERIGVAALDDLFTSIPAGVRLRRQLDLPAGLTEEEVRRRLQRLAARNHGQDELISFLGGGVYDSIIPAAIPALVGRSEFLTAYTPYQAEVSQGTLQVIYEWQTFLCRLTGLPVANASMYDGATALAEAVRMGVLLRKRPKALVPRTLNPRYRRVLATTLAGEGIALVESPSAPDGTTDPSRLRELAAGAGVVVIQNPNHLGLLEPVDELAAAASAAGAAVVACVNPVSLSLLKTPAEFGAQIAVGEAQPFGIPCCFGGPLLGFLACADELKRHLPGRVVGRTVDHDGRPAFVLTLQTREQHIRRDKATSNICTNQGLNALRATIYLAMLGPVGLRELGEANRVRCEALRAAVRELPGVALPYPGPVFNETVIRLAKPARAFRAHARRAGLLAGIPLAGFADCGEGDLLVAVTEKRTAAEIELYAQTLREFLAM